ncbi:XRE family transcriptional regulator [Salibacter sp.]|uniref:helix-turn-helix domain-containing protein n=1 Tax=Salibacter sp. TaxID=2010995 RepID=UPI00286FB4C5|nr:XRE family transcriptional regulator [Salibacter sp.]MDR9398119.1 XRE family transcriptional regulator [Salibacter sp.]MDR9487567.1 XRE family transcriptional regulator [Salibacter sp.]
MLNNQFSIRLKLARSLAGLSQDELVQKMNGLVSKNAISKYEKGLMMPGSSVLVELSKALEVKTDFFFRNETIELPEVKFRKHSRLKKSEIKKIIAQSTDLLERYLEVESILVLGGKFHNPIKNINCKNIDDAKNAAIKLREYWELGLNPIPNVIEMLEYHEVKVFEFTTSDGFDGLSTWVGDIPLVVLNKSFNVLRKRFTALHELGHVLLNIDRKKIDEKVEEKLCNAFANELLIPSEKLVENIGKHRKSISLNELIDLKEYYGISIAALMYKVRELKIVNESMIKRFWLLRNRDIELKLESEPKYGVYEGKEESDRFNQLIYRAASEEVVSMSKAASLANMKLADFRDEFLTV